MNSEYTLKYREKSMNIARCPFCYSKDIDVCYSSTASADGGEKISLRRVCRSCGCQGPPVVGSSSGGALRDLELMATELWDMRKGRA